STTSALNPFWCARSAYDRQYSSGCFEVRNGTMRSRGTSCPRLSTRCRRLSSSSAPTALSVRNTYVPCLVSPRTAWYVSIQASMPSLVASSARGGRSSAANTDVPERRAERRSIQVRSLKYEVRSTKPEVGQSNFRSESLTRGRLSDFGLHT